LSSPFFTNLKYDECQIRKQDCERVAEYKYVFDTPQTQSQECLMLDSPYNNFRSYTGLSPDRVDIESELRQDFNKLSKCPENHFPYKKKSFDNLNKKICNEQVENFLLPNYTRTNKTDNSRQELKLKDHAFCKITETQDSQQFQNIHQNSQIGLNTRSYTKKYYDIANGIKSNYRYKLDDNAL
jgi:hypothetical protein